MARNGGVVSTGGKPAEGAAGGLELREYQRGAVRALTERWRGGMRRLAVVLPTGAGKTVVFADLVRRVALAGGRSLVLAHRDELIEQAVQKLHDASPDLRVGVWKAGRREVVGRQAVVASVQSLARQASRNALADAFNANLIIVDECHHAVADTYMNILQDFGAFNPPEENGPVVAGFTATLARGDGVALGEVWQDVADRVGIVDLIRQRFLCTARGVRVAIEGLDLRRVGRVGGDWAGRALGQALSDCLAPEAIARAYVEHAKDRQGIVFVPSVAFAHELAPVLTEAGVAAVALDGGSHIDQRRAALRDYRAGRVQALVNCGLFTEGTDLPMTSVVVIARPTSSAPLYVQMAGRGLRTWPGKRDCLIMDVVGVSGRHRLTSLVDLAGGERAEKLTEEERERLAELSAELDLDLVGMTEADVTGRTMPTPNQVDGVLVSEEVDLFGASHQAWLRTYRGVWFLAAGDFVVALVPNGGDDGLYGVCVMPMGAAGGRWLVRDMDLSYAMSWGEKEIRSIELGLSYRVAKSASWRKGAVSREQIDLLRRMGVMIGPDWTKSDASDAISVHKASRRLDHLPMFQGVTR